VLKASFPIAHPYSCRNVGVFPSEFIHEAGTAKSEHTELISHEIIFEEFQPVWPHHGQTAQTDRWTDRQQTDRQTTCRSNTLLCEASHGKNEIKTL